jgi:hypothetical protein
MSDFYFLRVPNKKYSKESLKKKRILKNKNFHYYFFNMFLLKNVQFKWQNLFVFKQNNIKWTKSNYENYSFKFFCIFLISGPFWIVGAVLKIIGTGPVSRSWKRRRKSLVLKITQILSKEDKKRIEELTMKVNQWKGSSELEVEIRGGENDDIGRSYL